MSRVHSDNILNELDKKLQTILRAGSFHEGLELCLANMFNIIENNECKHISDINTTVYSFCLKANRNNTDYCYQELADILFNCMISYTIPKSELEMAFSTGQPQRVLELQAKAARKYVDYWKKRDEIVKLEQIQDENITKSGEGGEELLFLLAEQILKLPQALCKMNLKTSGAVHFHGADGIHIGLNDDKTKLALYYSEAKVYKNVNEAIKKCLNSIAPLLLRKEKEETELDLLNSYLDLGSNNELACLLKEYYFNPSRVECKENTEVRGLCLVAFNEKEYKGFNFNNNAKAIFPNVSEWIAKFQSEKINENIKDIAINVFFVPMSCVETFRSTFKNKLRLYRD